MRKYTQSLHWQRVFMATVCTFASTFVLPVYAFAARRGGESIRDVFSDPQRFAAFIESRIGSYLLVLSFFGLIVWFLRFLYGPKGLFRSSLQEMLEKPQPEAENSDTTASPKQDDH